MTLLQAILLGLIQGLTEFFPISSSAHLRLAKWLLEVPDADQLLFFDLVCHMGTLLAAMFFLRREILAILTSWRQIALYTVALIPLVPAYFLLKPLREAASDPAYLGYCLMATSLLLFAAAERKTHTPQTSPHPKWRDVLCIGAMQAMALIPGISRSGSTIAAARFCGWEWNRAARFSFLLAIPAILGGQCLESWRMLKGASFSGAVDWPCYCAGGIASLAMGLLSVRLVFWIYEKQWIRPIAAYCFAIGLVAWAIFRG